MRLKKGSIRRCRLTGAAAIALTPLVASGQGLLLNPHFDTDLSDWFANAGMAWSSSENHGGGGSTGVGSALATTPGSGFAAVLSQCTPVAPSRKYAFGTWLFRPAMQTCSADLDHFLQVTWSQDTACAMPAAGSPSNRTLPAESFGAWELLHEEATSPSDAHGARIDLLAYCNEAGFQAYFDDPFIVEDRIFASAFE